MVSSLMMTIFNYIIVYYYTALLNAVERSVHLHGPSGGRLF